MRTRVHNPNVRRLQAFTLTEVVISMLIINIAAAGLMGCFKYAFFVTGLARDNQRATQVLLERTEAVRLCSWDQVCSNGFIPTDFLDYFDPSAPAGSRGVTYTGTVAVTAVPFNASYSANMRQLTLTVAWRSGSIDRRRTNVTYIAKDGVQNYVY
jgi:type II secretory pathway pseudopilin PulG